MKWRLCIAIAEPQQSYPAAKKPETDADTAFGPSRPEMASKKARNRRRYGVRSESARDGQFAFRVGPERLSYIASIETDITHAGSVQSSDELVFTASGAKGNELMPPRAPIALPEPTWPAVFRGQY